MRDERAEPSGTGIEPLDVDQGVGDRSEAAERLEPLAERDDELGLRERVLVVAGRVVDRDARGLLALVPLARLLRGRVRLQRQGRGGGEHLEEEGQAGAPRPRASSGSAAIQSSRVSAPPTIAGFTTTLGLPGWAPSQSSAWGAPVTVRPRSSGIAVTDPQA